MYNVGKTAWHLRLYECVCFYKLRELDYKTCFLLELQSTNSYRLSKILEQCHIQLEGCSIIAHLICRSHKLITFTKIK